MNRYELNADWEDYDPYESDADWEDITPGGAVDVEDAGFQADDGERPGGWIQAAKGLAVAPRILTEQIGAKALQLYRGSDIDTEDDWKDRYIREAGENLKGYIHEYGGPEDDPTSFLGIKPRHVAESVGNLAYSGISAGAGLAVGGATRLIPRVGKHLSYPAGGAASGVAAYRMAKDEIMQSYFDSVNEEAMERAGRPLNEDEWQQAKEMFESQATQYGLWEAVPEALGSMVGFKLLTGPLKSLVGTKIASKMTGKLSGSFLGKAVGVAGRGAGVLGEELATETITQAGLPGAESGGAWKGQAGVEARAGLREKDIGVVEGFKEIYGPTVMTTMMMGPLAKGAHSGFSAVRKGLASDEKDILGSGEGLLTREESQRAKYLDQLTTGIDSGEIDIDHVQALREKLDDADPLAQMLDDVFLQPSRFGPDPTHADPQTADFEARLRNQATINKTMREQAEAEEAQAVVAEQIEAQAEWEDIAPGQAGLQVEPSQAPDLGTPVDMSEFEQVPPKGLMTPEQLEEARRGVRYERGIKVEPSQVPDRATAVDMSGFDREAHEAATSPLNDLPEPTEAQKEAGNYKKAHVSVQGFDISIENPKGSTRTGTAPDGTEWQTEMTHHYGYFKRSEGKDGDQIDVFVGPNPESEIAYIVDQIAPETGKFDEHKVLMGFESLEDAEEGYLSNYEEGWQGIGNITEVPIDELKKFVEGGKQTKPYAPFEMEERRQDIEKRKRIDEMTPEEMQKELKTDFLTGLGNKRALHEAKPKPVMSSLDMDSLGYVNDTYGHDAGDTALKLMGDALKNTDAVRDTYHISGDEFVIQGETEQEVDAAIQRAYEYLKKNPLEIEHEDGSVDVIPISFSYGKGETYETADKRLLVHKKAREARGERSPTKVEPPGVFKKPARGVETEDRGEGVPEAEEVAPPAEKPPKIRKAPVRGAGVRTLRGRIKMMGGINFLNFTGELRNLPTSVRFLANKKGFPIDLAEETLKAEGWLAENEDLLDLLRDPEVLKRDNLKRDMEEKAPHELAPEEKRIKEEMEHEPEAPPEGDYVQMKAEDLPLHQTMTIIEGDSVDGWDTYRVTDKDEFGITLKDGTTIELAPLDTVEVLKSDIEEAPAVEKEPEKKGIGVNQEGNEIFEDEDGNRYFVRNGIRVSASRPILSTGKRLEPRTPADLYKTPLHRQFLTKDEIEELEKDLEVKEDPRTAATGIITGGKVDYIEGKGYEIGWADDIGAIKAKSDLYYDLAGMISGGQADQFIEAGLSIRPVEKIEEAPKAEEKPIKPKEEPLGKPGASDKIAKWVENRLRDKNPITWQQLFESATTAFGGTQAEGAFTPKDAYDAMELGVNRFLDDQLTIDPTMDRKFARGNVMALKGLIELLPTQSKRTKEMDEFQQFSTPPPLAYVANWAANISQDDVVLEPSAGIGGIAVFSKLAGAKEIIVNELSPRRAELLKFLGFNRVFTEDAEQINNILPKDVKPSVIVMNPPFSATGGRLAKTATRHGARHIEQALERLEPGGRLVAVVGKGMADDAASFRIWWNKIKKKYNVMANIGIDGEEYRKYGTTFDNQLIIIDKTDKIDYNIITGKVKKIEDLIPLIEEVRNERTHPAEQKPAEREGERIAPEGEARRGPVAPVLVPTDALEPGKREDSIEVSPIEGEPSGRPLRVEPGRGDEAVAGERPGRQGEPVEPGLERPVEPGERPTGKPAFEPDRETAGIPDSEQPPIELELEAVKKEAQGELTEDLYEGYAPELIKIAGAKKHPTKLVQSAAMAAVHPPKPTYNPNLPKKPIESGKISDIQIESVVYAGQAHEGTLPDGSRRGYFIGDGTGVGKGREIAAIIWDNWNKGRKKALWISEKKNLAKDARRDTEGVGWDGKVIFEHGKIKASSEIQAGNGVLFTTYDTLKARQKGEDAKSRLDQIVEWVGEDFDGVIAFDESHNMGNAVAIKGERGTKQPSMKALAGVELQRRLPNARVIYVSATGATEVINLAYANRLGLWGEATPFAGVEDFVNQISAAGVAGMELVAQNMKSMGVYNARSLSYDGVGYERLEHKLTDKQKDIYNKLAEGWQVVLRNINEALVATGVVSDTGQSLDGHAKGAAFSAFWGSHQRFFNQIITAMQTPAMINAIKEDIKNGHAVVIQLVNTMEASQERAISRMTEEDSLEDLDLTPRDILMEYVKNGFPVRQFEQYEDEEGNIRSRPVVDSAGEPVLNAEAVAMRERLLDELGSIRVPDSPIDMIIDEFGVDTVAEITGRKRRVVWKQTEKGLERVIEKRSQSKTNADAELFQDDRKRILLFSEAGGTGRSYHPDLDIKNQRKRIHYLLQAGWRADKAIQGLGRTHRSNQKQPPKYVLVTTDIKGQKRFVSSVARRLDQLGALTKGQRQTGSQGIFQARDNLESDYANAALRQFYDDLSSGDIESATITEFEEQTGLKLTDKYGNLLADLPPMRSFMNRLLSMNLSMMDAVFDEFSLRMDQVIEAHINAGTLDVGLETLKADKIEKVVEETVYTDEKSGAKTKYIQVDVTNPTPLYKWKHAEDYADKFFKNIKSGKIWAGKLRTITNRTTGAIEDVWVLKSPTYGNQRIRKDDFSDEKWEKLRTKAAEKSWNQAIDEAPKTTTEQKHLITGALLPIWDRLIGHPRIMRMQTDKGERFIGRLVSQRDLNKTLRNLGAAAVKVEITPEEIHGQVYYRGYKAELANQWTISRRRVSGEDRIELTGPNFSDFEHLKKHGVFSERINYDTRYFIPFTEDGVKAVEFIVKNAPVVEMIPPKGEIAQEVDMFGKPPPGQQEMFDIPKGPKAEKKKRVKKEKLEKSQTQLDLFTGEGEQIQIQLFETFVKGEKPKLEEVKPGSLPIDYQRTRMQTTGHIKAAGNLVRSSDEAVSLISHIRKSAQEDVYGITTDKNGIVLEIHRYGKGTMGSAKVSVVEFAGHVLNTPDAAFFFFIHNHPGGDVVPSTHDIVLTREIEDLLSLKDIKTHALIITENKYVEYAGRGTGRERIPKQINPVLRKVDLPVKERVYGRRKLEPVIDSSEKAKARFKEKYGNVEGFIFLDAGLHEVGFLPFVSGKPMKDMTIALISQAERVNATGFIFNSTKPFMTNEKRVKYFKNLLTVLDNSLQIFDISDQGKSLNDHGMLNRLRGPSTWEAIRSEEPLLSVTEPLPYTKKEDITLSREEVETLRKAKPDTLKTIEGRGHRNKITRMFKAKGFKNPDAFRVVKPETDEQKQIVKIAKELGLKAVFFDTLDPQIGVNGVIDAKAPNVVYLNTKPKNKSVLMVAGHEVLHTLKAKHPEVYKFLKSALIKNKAIGFDEYLKRINEQRAKVLPDYKTMKAEEVFDEFMADFAGEQWADPEFWKILAKENPTLAQKVMEIVREVLDKIMSYLTDNNIKGKYFEDIKAAQKNLAVAMKEYTEAEREGIEAAIPDKALTEEMPLFQIKGTKGKAELDKWANKFLDKYTKEIPVKARDYKPPPSMFEKFKDDWFSEKDWSVQKNSVEAKKLQDAIKETLGEKRYTQKCKDADKAIHVYLDLKRNPDHLDEYYGDLNPEQKKIVDLAQTIESNPRLKAIADYIANEYEQTGFHALDAGIIHNVLDNYAARAWKIPKKFSTDNLQKFKTTSRHAKQRVFETILEGQAIGFELQVEGATNNLSLLKDEISRTIEDKKLVKQMMASKDEDGNPLIVERMIGGYQAIDHPNFTYWGPAVYVKEGEIRTYGPGHLVESKYGVIKEGKERASHLFDSEAEARQFISMEENPGEWRVASRHSVREKKQLYAPIEMAKSLNRILGVSKLKGAVEIGGVSMVDVLTKYNAVFKAWILITSFFHHLAFMRSYLMGTRRKTLAEWSPRQAYKKGLEAINEMKPEIELLVRNGLTLGRMQDWEEAILRNEQTIFGKAIDKLGPVPKAFKDWINNLRERQANFLFRSFGAGLKAQAGLIEYRNALKEHPEMEPNDRAKMVAKLINDDFGGLHLGRMDRDPTIQHIFRLLALAPDWTESNVRTMYKAFVSGEKETRQLYRRFWASVVTKGVVATLLANILLSIGDDEDLLDKFKRAWKEGNFRWLDVDITRIYKLLGGKTEARKYFSIVGHFKDPIKFVRYSGRSMKHKGSVVSRMFFEAYGGTDWRGQRFTTLSELIGIDDKGVYVTTVKGKHKAGDPKGGKLAGRLTAYGKTGTIDWEQVPSYLLSQVRGVQPIQVQNLISYITGEVEGFDAVARSLGLHTSSTYPTERSTLKDFSEQYVDIRSKGRNLAPLKKAVREYNERQEDLDDGVKIPWLKIVRKGNRLRKAERANIK